jgi:hypothetical protein
VKLASTTETTEALLAYARGAGAVAKATVRSERMMTECYSCIHARQVPGDAHILCAKFDDEMTVDPHGAARGWATYPVLFDPVWKTKECRNHEGS